MGYINQWTASRRGDCGLYIHRILVLISNIEHRTLYNLRGRATNNHLHFVSSSSGKSWYCKPLVSCKWLLIFKQFPSQNKGSLCSVLYSKPPHNTAGRSLPTLSSIRGVSFIYRPVINRQEEELITYWNARLALLCPANILLDQISRMVVQAPIRVVPTARLCHVDKNIREKFGASLRLLPL